MVFRDSVGLVDVMKVRLLSACFVVFLCLIQVEPVFAANLLDSLNIGFLGVDEKKSEKIIWQDGPNRYIKIVPQDSTNFGLNEHPVNLSAEDINISLSQLKIDTGRGVIPVFSEEQIIRLSDGLASGLSVANTEQDIIFVLEKPESQMMGQTNADFFVAGRVFYQWGRLNLVLGDYDRVRNIGFESAYDPKSADTHNYRFDHGKRTSESVSPNLIDKKAFDTPGISNKFVTSGRRSDWFQVDVNKISSAFDKRKRMAFQQAKSEKLMEMQSLFGSGSGASPVTSGRTIEERLVSLNSLKNKGLISEEEYSLKRKQILDDL